MSRNGQRDPKGRPKGVQGHSKGNQRGPKDAQREPKRVKRSPKSAQGPPKALQRHPKEAKGSQRERYMLKKSRGVFFLRSPKRRRQLGHRRTLLGDPETSKKYKCLTIYYIFQQYIYIYRLHVNISTCFKKIWTF